MLGERVFLLFQVFIFVFEDLNFFLHDILVKVHFFGHFFDNSLIIFRFGLGPGFHSGKELILFFKVILFECDFAEFFLNFLDFSLFVGEFISPLILKGLKFLFLLVSDFLGFKFLAFSDLLDGDFELTFADA